MKIDWVAYFNRADVKRTREAYGEPPETRVSKICALSQAMGVRGDLLAVTARLTDDLVGFIYSQIFEADESVGTTSIGYFEINGRGFLRFASSHEFFDMTQTTFDVRRKNAAIMLQAKQHAISRALIVPQADVEPCKVMSLGTVRNAFVYAFDVQIGVSDSDKNAKQKPVTIIDESTDKARLVSRLIHYLEAIAPSELAPYGVQWVKITTPKRRIFRTLFLEWGGDQLSDMGSAIVYSKLCKLPMSDMDKRYTLSVSTGPMPRSLAVRSWMLSAKLGIENVELDEKTGVVSFTMGDKTVRYRSRNGQPTPVHLGYFFRLERLDIENIHFAGLGYHGGIEIFELPLGVNHVTELNKLIETGRYVVGAAEQIGWIVKQALEQG